MSCVLNSQDRRMQIFRCTEDSMTPKSVQCTYPASKLKNPRNPSVIPCPHNILGEGGGPGLYNPAFCTELSLNGTLSARLEWYFCSTNLRN